MGFDKSEVLKCIKGSNNVPEALLLYIARNGCAEFKCRKCPLGLVCDHYPVNSRNYAQAVLAKAHEKLEEMQKASK